MIEITIGGGRAVLRDGVWDASDLALLRVLNRYLHEVRPYLPDPEGQIVDALRKAYPHDVVIVSRNGRRADDDPSDGVEHASSQA